MDTLTYSLCYTPALIKGDFPNPVCSDKKIHVRLRDFNKAQVIRGFERKLTYLISYLINYGSMAKLQGVCEDRTIIKAFLESTDSQQLVQVIRGAGQIPFKGFVVRTNYKKESSADNKAFGCVLPEVFPLSYDKFGIHIEGTLNNFLSKLNITLFDYLFNDAYAILLHKAPSTDANNKYINRENRKINRLLGDFEKLW